MSNFDIKQIIKVSGDKDILQSIAYGRKLNESQKSRLGRKLSPVKGTIAKQSMRAKLKRTFSNLSLSRSRDDDSDFDFADTMVKEIEDSPEAMLAIMTLLKDEIQTDEDKIYILARALGVKNPSIGGGEHKLNRIKDNIDDPSKVFTILELVGKNPIMKEAFNRIKTNMAEWKEPGKSRVNIQIKNLSKLTLLVETVSTLKYGKQLLYDMNNELENLQKYLSGEEELLQDILEELIGDCRQKNEVETAKHFPLMEEIVKYKSKILKQINEGYYSKESSENIKKRVNENFNAMANYFSSLSQLERIRLSKIKLSGKNLKKFHQKYRNEEWDKTKLVDITKELLLGPSAMRVLKGNLNLIGSSRVKQRKHFESNVKDMDTIMTIHEQRGHPLMSAALKNLKMEYSKEHEFDLKRNIKAIENQINYIVELSKILSAVPDEDSKSLSMMDERAISLSIQSRLMKEFEVLLAGQFKSLEKSLDDSNIGTLKSDDLHNFQTFKFDELVKEVAIRKLEEDINLNVVGLDSKISGKIINNFKKRINEGLSKQEVLKLYKEALEEAFHQGGLANIVPYMNGEKKLDKKGVEKLKEDVKTFIDEHRDVKRFVGHTSPGTARRKLLLDIVAHGVKEEIGGEGGLSEISGHEGVYKIGETYLKVNGEYEEFIWNFSEKLGISNNFVATKTMEMKIDGKLQNVSVQRALGYQNLQDKFNEVTKDLRESKIKLMEKERIGRNDPKVLAKEKEIMNLFSKIELKKGSVIEGLLTATTLGMFDGHLNNIFIDEHGKLRFFDNGRCLPHSNKGLIRSESEGSILIPSFKCQLLLFPSAYEPLTANEKEQVLNDINARLDKLADEEANMNEGKALIDEFVEKIDTEMLVEEFEDLSSSGERGVEPGGLEQYYDKKKMMASTRERLVKMKEAVLSSGTKEISMSDVVISAYPSIKFFAVLDYLNNHPDITAQTALGRVGDFDLMKLLEGCAQKGINIQEVFNLYDKGIPFDQLIKNVEDLKKIEPESSGGAVDSVYNSFVGGDDLIDFKDPK